MFLEQAHDLTEDEIIEERLRANFAAKWDPDTGVQTAYIDPLLAPPLPALTEAYLLREAVRIAGETEMPLYDVIAWLDDRVGRIAGRIGVRTGTWRHLREAVSAPSKKARCIDVASALTVLRGESVSADTVSKADANLRKSSAKDFASAKRIVDEMDDRWNCCAPPA